VAACLAAGFGLLVLWRKDLLSVGEVLVGALILRAVFVPLGPGLSDDMFRYVWDGWLQWEGINPYRYAPSDAALARFQDTELYRQLNSKEYHSVYPPLSQLLFAVGGWAGSSWLSGYYAIKAGFVVLEGAGVWLLSRITTARNLLLYAWNPLVLVEVAGQGHTEAAAVLGIVGAVWAVQTNRGRIASLAVAAAGLVKLYPLVLGPYLLRRFGWRAVWPGALLAAAACLPYAEPYVVPHMKASVDLYVRLFEFNAGPYYTLKEAFAAATGADWSKQIGPALRLLFLASLPILYGLDARREWPFSQAALYALGTFFVFSTTVHPWYLLTLLPLAVTGRRPSWAWLWLGLLSIGTYLFYVDGPYWVWVGVGWGGAAVLGLAARPAISSFVRSRADALLQEIQKQRGWRKAGEVVRLLQAGDLLSDGLSTAPDGTEEKSEEGRSGRAADDFRGSGARLQVLDLGAGEGYVAQALQRQTGAAVTLADVVDLNRTDLPHRCYDGRSLPLDDDAVDVTILYFVLHHAEDPEAVLREALRVSRSRVVVAESIVTGRGQHLLLRMLDRLANRLRSGGALRAQERHLSFRSAGAWADLARRLGATVRHAEVRRHPIHPQGFYVLEPSSCTAASPVAVEAEGDESAGEEEREAASA
jgi:SAM-dependent methyltransferase